MRTSVSWVNRLLALILVLSVVGTASAQMKIEPGSTGGGGGGGMNTNASNATAAAFGNLVAGSGIATARAALALDTGNSPTFTGLTLSGLGAGTLCVHSTNGVLGVAAADCGTSSGITQLTGGVTAGPGSGSQAATVVTNANLTGPITSSGNATAIASQTGTGTKFVVDNGPTLIAPVLGVATATSVNKLTLTQPATGSTLTIADGKTLTDTSGTGAVALKGATGGGFAQAACADLSNGATGCSTATGTSGATIPLLNAANSWSAAQTFTAAAPQVILGVNTTTLGSVKMFGNTSGDLTINPAAVAGTSSVATFPANTGTVAELNLAQTFTAAQTFGPVFGGIITDSTTTRTLSAGDCGQVINFTSGSAIAVTTANLAVGCHVVLRQGGAGQITVAAGGGTTIVSASSYTKTRAQYSKIGLSIIATTVTDIDGDGA